MASAFVVFPFFLFQSDVSVLAITILYRDLQYGVGVLMLDEVGNQKIPMILHVDLPLQFPIRRQPLLPYSSRWSGAPPEHRLFVPILVLMPWISVCRMLGASSRAFVT